MLGAHLEPAAVVFFLVLITLVLVAAHAAAPPVPPSPIPSTLPGTYSLIAVWVTSPNVTIPVNSQVEPILWALKGQGASMALLTGVADYSNATMSRWRDLTGSGNAMGPPNIILAVDANTTIVQVGHAVGTGIGSSSSILLTGPPPVTLT